MQEQGAGSRTTRALRIWKEMDQAAWMMGYGLLSAVFNWAEVAGWWLAGFGKGGILGVISGSSVFWCMRVKNQRPNNIKTRTEPRIDN